MVVKDLVEELKKLKKNEFIDEAIRFLERGNLKWVDTDESLVSSAAFIDNDTLRDSLLSHGFSKCINNIDTLADELYLPEHFECTFDDDIGMMLDECIHSLDSELEKE